MIFKNKKVWLSVSVVFMILILIKTSGTSNWYYETSNNMHPEFKANSSIFTTNLGGFEREDVVLINYKDSLKEEYFSFLRLIGKPKDTILIENNIVYVNGKEIDNNRALSFQYNVSLSIYNQIKDSPEFTSTDSEDRLLYYDLLRVHLKEDFAEKRKLTSMRLRHSKEEINEFIKEQYGEKWNPHFFGPIILPPDKFFLLGDNRDVAFDSRYIGLINQNAVLSRVVFSINF